MARRPLLQRIMFKQEIKYERLNESQSKLYVETIPRKNIFSKIVIFIWFFYLVLTHKR